MCDTKLINNATHTHTATQWHIHMTSRYSRLLYLCVSEKASFDVTKMDVFGRCVPLEMVACENPLKNWTVIDSTFFALLMSSIPVGKRWIKHSCHLCLFGIPTKWNSGRWCLVYNSGRCCVWPMNVLAFSAKNAKGIAERGRFPYV